MTSFRFFVQLADRTLILKQKEFFVFIIATRLFLNHSPSEWFSLYKKRPQYQIGKAALFRGAEIGERKTPGDSYTRMATSAAARRAMGTRNGEQDT